MDKTPVSLLQRLRQHPTPEEWRRFTTVFVPVLYRWASRLGAQPADAADLVQDVLLAVFQKLPSFEYDASRSFRAWLYVMLRNAWLTRRRRYGREAVLTGELDHLSDGAQWAGDGRADDDRDPDIEDYRRQVVGRVAQLVRGDFEPKTWQAVWETLTGDERIAAVARRHGMTANALYLARCRVLRRLRLELGDLIS